MLMVAATDAGSPRPAVECIEGTEVARLLPPGAVHQGFAVLAKPLPAVSLADVCNRSLGQARAGVVVLDQATDPRNVGAVIRSAAAFSAGAVILQDRHAPPAAGALIKAASGAFEQVPLVTVTNIARSLRALQEAGFTTVGLAGEADAPIAAAMRAGRLAIVLGSEDRGLRRLVREQCDRVARIEISRHTESLNVSVAAAIALYEWSRGTPR